MADEAWHAEDVALMRRLAGDDPAALRSLVERYQGVLMNYFIRSGAQSHAEDLVQETFLRLYRYRHRYRPVARLTTFLHTLARHAWIDHVRRRSRLGRLLQDWAQAQPTEDVSSAGRAGRRLDAERAVDALPDAMRDVVVLVFYQGLSFGEAAEVLEIPVGTVKSRMFHALRRLKEALQDAP